MFFETMFTCELGRTILIHGWLCARNVWLWDPVEFDTIIRTAGS